ncbi:MAG: hypothetical protein ACI8PT_003231 [Gammaproteobacteria bacterium]|jgi:hypothetical protein
MGRGMPYLNSREAQRANGGATRDTRPHSRTAAILGTRDRTFRVGNFRFGRSATTHPTALPGADLAFRLLQANDETSERRC